MERADMGALQKKVADNPNDTVARCELAVAHLRRGELDEAAQHAEQVLEVAEETASAHAVLGLVALQGGDVPGAVSRFDRTLDLDPAHFGALATRGMIRCLMRDFRGAATDLSAATAVDGDNPQAWEQLGEAQLELLQFAEAQASFDRAVGLAPDAAGALAGRGKAKHKLRNFEEAIADYDEALAVGAEDEGEVKHCLSCAKEGRDYEDAMAKHTKNILDSMAQAEHGFDSDDDLTAEGLVTALEQAYGLTLPQRYRDFLVNGEYEKYEDMVAGHDPVGNAFTPLFVVRELTDVGELLAEIDMGLDGDEFRGDHPTLIPFAVLAWEEPPDYQAEEAQFFLIDTSSDACPVLFYTSTAEAEEDSPSLDAFLKSLAEGRTDEDDEDDED